jgi:hypothetical protein
MTTSSTPVSAVRQLRNLIGDILDCLSGRRSPCVREDALWESRGLGRFEGRETIRNFFRGASEIFHSRSITA